MRDISIPVRHYRLYTDLDVPCREENFHYVERTWVLPVEATGIVLVDCWDLHYMASHLERTNVIAQQRLAPVVQACRRAGITVIHAPSPQTAAKYPQWTHYAADETLFGKEREEPEWPPADFRRREGRFAVYGRPPEPLQPRIERERSERNIVACLAPQPGDFVIATGEQLHRLCHHRGLLHLFYGGFAANICVLYRDYGMRAMGRDRGYNVILLRDCTTAVETHDTLQEELLLKVAIRSIEMDFGTTTTSEALLSACAALDQ